MRTRHLGVLIALLLAGCMQSAMWKDMPPECGNEKLAYATAGYLGRGDARACFAEMQRQGGFQKFMKSPEEMGVRPRQSQQQNMSPMTPEQYQQSQQIMQQMQPFMQQMQGGTMPSGQRPTGQPNLMQPGPQQMPQGMPQMTPEQQELMRQQMQQQPQTQPPTQ
jgi:hypothetical protein